MQKGTFSTRPPPAPICTLYVCKIAEIKPSLPPPCVRTLWTDPTNVIRQIPLIIIIVVTDKFAQYIFTIRCQCNHEIFKTKFQLQLLTMIKNQSCGPVRGGWPPPLAKLGVKILVFTHPSGGLVFLWFLLQIMHYVMEEFGSKIVGKRNMIRLNQPEYITEKCWKVSTSKTSWKELQH